MLIFYFFNLGKNKNQIFYFKHENSNYSFNLGKKFEIQTPNFDFLFFFFSSALKSVLRKTRSSNAPSSPKDSKASKSEAGYDFIEGSGFVIEGLEDKGLDAKSYIQQMLRRTDASSREEQIIQKEQILAQLQVKFNSNYFEKFVNFFFIFFTAS